MPDKNPVDRHAELLGVQLLDVLATVESALRHGRDVSVKRCAPAACHLRLRPCRDARPRRPFASA
jgi:hypothetical protein